MQTYADVLLTTRQFEVGRPVSDLWRALRVLVELAVALAITAIAAACIWTMATEDMGYWFAASFFVGFAAGLWYWFACDLADLRHWRVRQAQNVVDSVEATSLNGHNPTVQAFVREVHPGIELTQWPATVEVSGLAYRHLIGNRFELEVGNCRVQL